MGRLRNDYFKARNMHQYCCMIETIASASSTQEGIIDSSIYVYRLGLKFNYLITDGLHDESLNQSGRYGDRIRRMSIYGNDYESEDYAC